MKNIQNIERIFFMVISAKFIEKQIEREIARKGDQVHCMINVYKLQHARMFLVLMGTH